MGPFKKSLIVAAVLLGLLVALPFILPLNVFFIDKLESALSQKLQSKVNISNISFRYAPYPTLVLENVEMGPAAKDGSIKSVEVQVDLLTLLQDQKEIRKVQVRESSFDYGFLREVPARLKQRTGNSGYIVKTLAFDKVEIKQDKQTYGPIAAEVTLNPDQSMKQVVLRNEGDSVTVTIKPQGNTFTLSASARNWEATLPAKGNEAARKVTFQALSLEGEARGQSIFANAIKGSIAGGRFEGSALFDWTQGWAVSGKLTLSDVKGEELLDGISPRTRVTGRLSANLDFSMASFNLDQLLDSLQLKGVFSAKDGVLENFDFVSPARRNASASGVQGGSTKYNTLSGAISKEGPRLSLSNIKLVSGNLVVSANLSANNGKLAGNARVSLGSLATTERIAGDFDSPVVIPTGQPSSTSVTQITSY